MATQTNPEIDEYFRKAGEEFRRVADLLTEMKNAMAPIPRYPPGAEIRPETPAMIGESGPEVIKLGDSMLVRIVEPINNLIMARDVVDKFYANRTEAMRERPINQLK